MSADFNIVIQQLKQQRSDLIAVYRFGSAGTRYERKDSDLDLAVLTENPLDNLARWELAESIARLVSRDVDLIDLIRAAPPIRMQIIQEGQRIYCRDEMVANLFEANSMTQYQHLNEERREVVESFKARLKGHRQLPDDEGIG